MYALCTDVAVLAVKTKRKSVFPNRLPPPHLGGKFSFPFFFFFFFFFLPLRNYFSFVILCIFFVFRFLSLGFWLSLLMCSLWSFSTPICEEEILTDVVAAIFVARRCGAWIKSLMMMNLGFAPILKTLVCSSSNLAIFVVSGIFVSQNSIRKLRTKTLI